HLPLYLFLFTAPSTPQIYTLSLHDALPISSSERCPCAANGDWASSPIVRSRRGSSPVSTRHRPSSPRRTTAVGSTGSRAVPCTRSEEHTSELQSRFDLVCRLLLEKKKKNNK